MVDITVEKGFWRSIRAFLRLCAHMALIPVVAVLKASVAFCTYLHDEVAKV